jgi:hypothetical protein
LQICIFHFAIFILQFLPVSVSPAFAQFKEGAPGGAKTGPAQVHRWKAGVVIQASAGPCRSVTGYVPVPMEWPEQTVKVFAQDVSPGVKISYQTLSDSARLLLISIPWIAGGETAKATVTFECNRSMQLLPEDKAAFSLPDLKKLDPAIRRYLGSSPMIETQNAVVRKAAKENSTAKRAWDRVEALYNFVRAKVSYENGIESKGAAAALKNGKANHDDMSALFVALCRDADVPARLVWVPEFCYAEFYLVDKQGDGHWLPCAPAGAKAFGEMPDTKLILAKGDNFRPPDSRERQRYIRTNLSVHPGAQGAGRPSVQWVGQQEN